jgi:hypothetical protein
MCKALSELTSRRVRSGSSEQYRDNLCEPDHLTGIFLTLGSASFFVLYWLRQNRDMNSEGLLELLIENGCF